MDCYFLKGICMMAKTPYILLFLLPGLCYAQSNTAQPDPCADLLAVLNRPTVADSVCSVKPGKVIIESGVAYQSLSANDGHGFDLPETLIRFGLPLGNEINVFVPNYIRQNSTEDGTISGSTATIVGLKHQFLARNKWVYAAESIFTMPSGSDNFGSNAMGFAVNGIVDYSFTSSISATFMAGLTSETVSYHDGGGRYNSFNPDLVLDWEPTNNLQFYVEIYGQTKTAPEEHDGYNADVGIQYLITKNIEVDVEYGHRLTGELAGFSHYFGVGGGIRF
jgi:hypothetical protein